ncbi:MAG: acetate kinase [Deltaproteobacteria bacterium]|nr:acetate kinase [Deltaproteobacteria bacterium]
MKILVINTGSSSIKYQLFEMDQDQVLATGMVEKIGESGSIMTHQRRLEDGQFQKTALEGRIANHQEGFQHIVSFLGDPEHSVVKDRSEISAIGHRVVHGGEAFHAPVVIDEKVIEAIRENIPLAPLHNPANLMGIELTKEIVPDIPQVAVFDTAFHQTIPKRSYLYAIPFELYEKHRVRKYGFHGTSHAYVAERAADYLGKPLKELNLITIHLGNGASMAALQNGECVDTTMGMTPLSGLVMGTRSGDVDPALPFFLAEHLGMTLKDIDGLLNKESGLKGLCGTNDMREVIGKKEAGDEQASIALEIYAYRIKTYIGAYFAALGKLDALIFTGGIGENAPYIREVSCQGLEKLDIEIDSERNNQRGDGIREINTSGREVKVLVVPTNEELKIAQETKKVVKNLTDHS